LDFTEQVTIAILAKDKGHLLPLYLNLIENQTYPSQLIKLYIRTNNNNDNTQAVLEQWMDRVKDRYSEIYYDSSDVPEPVQEYEPHDWNILKLDVLKKIREDSIEWAKDRGTHYFVVDCDNFIVPSTLENLVKTGLPVVGPLLRNADDPASMYANYHHEVDDNGYYKSSNQYYEILYGRVKGLIEVAVIHCTYLVRNEVLDIAKYEDGSKRYDYVVFGDSMRKANIPQYIDNRYFYGSLTFCDTVEAFASKNITI
jgi:hypothetical protein